MSVELFFFLVLLAIVVPTILIVFVFEKKDKN